MLPGHSSIQSQPEEHHQTSASRIFKVSSKPRIQLIIIHHQPTHPHPLSPMPTLGARQERRPRAGRAPRACITSMS